MLPAVVSGTRRTTREQRAFAALARELDTVVLGARSALDDLLPDLRKFLAFDTLLVTTPVVGLDGLRLERFHSDAIADAPIVRGRFERLFAATRRRYAWYDPVSPEPAQRDRPMEATDLMTAEELARSAIYRDVLKPSGLDGLYQPRMLVCEGPMLLAWFGAFHEGRATPHQNRLMKKLLAPLRRRLSIERRLREAPRASAALGAALDLLAAPAFVVGPRGAALEANRSATALLESDPDVRTMLVDAIAGRPTRRAVEVVALRDRGAPDAFLVIVRDTSPEERTRVAIAQIAERWQLTPRQRDVLALSIEGHAVVTIAQLLHVSVRAVELHLTALFDKVGVDSRSALVASVLRTIA